MRITTSHQPLLNFVIKASIITVFAFGLLSLVESMAGKFFLNVVFSNYSPMKRITASLLMLSSFSLWFYVSQHSWRKHALRITGGIIVFVSFLTFLTYLHGNAAHRNDYLLFNFFLKGDNRMALITTVIFFFLGIIFILFANRSRKQDDIAHVLFFPAATLSYFSMISYVLGVSDIFRVEGIIIAPTTAVSLFLLCIVILFLKPSTWLMRILTGPGPGSIMGRRLLPWLLTLPIVIAWMRIKYEPQGYFPTGISAIVIAVTYTLSFILLVWWSGLHVNRIDEKRRQAHDALGESTARLNALIMAIADGVYKMSPDWKQMFSMEGGNFLTSVENPIDDWLNNFIPRDAQPMLLETINRAIATKSKFELEHKIIRQDGNIGWTQSRAIPVLDKNGKIVEWMGIAHDITERKNTQMALQQSEELFSKAFHNTPVPAIITRISDNIMTHVNSNFLKLFEYSSSEVIGHTTKELNLFTDYGQRMKALEMLIREGYIVDHEFIMLTKTGKQLTLLLSSVIVTIHEQKHVLTTYFDITERKNTELALQRSEKRLSDIYNSMSEGLSISQIVYDAQGKAVDYVLLDANPAFEKISGQKISEVKGKKATERYSMQEAPYLDIWEQVASSGEPTHFETYFPSFNKYLSASAFSPEKGKFAVLFRDITEIKLAEKALLESTEQFQLLFENSLDAILYTNSDGTVYSMNPEAERLLGRSNEEMQHLTKNEFIAINDPRYIAAQEEKQQTGRFKGELNFLKKDGTPFPVDVTWTIFKDSNDQEKSGFIIRDITERKLTEAEIIASKERAEESDRLKSAFLANMSHELRTPLNSIIGFSELLTDPDFDQNQGSQFAQIIHTSGTNLLSIINDIMDISKIEAGQVQVINKLFSVNKLMTELHAEYSLNAIQKGIAIIFDPSNPTEEVFIKSDQTKIRQILVNLVGNAIKFTEKGSVQLGWKVSGDFIEFHVKDSGIGIPGEFQTQIFERFRQVESSETRKYGGTGLGLAISKSLTELLGGTIWMESTKDEGSTFYFTVPNRQ